MGTGRHGERTDQGVNGAGPSGARRVKEGVKGPDGTTAGGGAQATVWLHCIASRATHEGSGDDGRLLCPGVGLGDVLRDGHRLRGVYSDKAAGRVLDVGQAAADEADGLLHRIELRLGVRDRLLGLCSQQAAQRRKLLLPESQLLPAQLHQLLHRCCLALVQAPQPRPEGFSHLPVTSPTIPRYLQVGGSPPTHTGYPRHPIFSGRGPSSRSVAFHVPPLHLLFLVGWLSPGAFPAGVVALATTVATTRLPWQAPVETTTGRFKRRP